MRRLLAKVKFSPLERDEISRELGDYLEDLCSESRASGADESSAISRAAGELDEDPHLGARLYRARKENAMNDRTRQFWLPAVVILIAGLAFFNLLAGFGDVFWINRVHRLFLGVNIPALVGLPLLAAAGAYWSRRQGARRSVQLAVGLFPVLWFFAASVANPQPILLNSWQLLPLRFAAQGFGPFRSARCRVLSWTRVDFPDLGIHSTGGAAVRNLAGHASINGASDQDSSCVIGIAKLRASSRQGSFLSANVMKFRASWPAIWKIYAATPAAVD